MQPKPRDALEEVTADALPREHVLRRVEDWLARINSLYDKLTSWVPHGLHVDRSRTTTMHEELMIKAGVPPRDLPIMRFERAGEEILVIQPFGLWIIGANGRLKASGKKGFASIVDRAGNFQRPKWEIAVGPDRLKTKPLTKSEFLRLL